ncbi:MAG: histidine triad nucleotide-binding protein [Burkholderiaceae bacterium]|nr:histidine triad nucleotide-binding protein [Burkholderiaceae bacterium]
MTDAAPSTVSPPATDPDCIFCKIAAGQIPSRRLHEDDELIAFFDIHPAAPVHFLIVPRRHIESLAHCTPADEGLLGKMMGLSVRLARAQGCDIRPDREGGFRTVINTGRDGGQEVFHLHMHVMGGPRPWKRG